VIREAPIRAEKTASEDHRAASFPRKSNDPEVASLVALLGRINAASPNLPPRPEVVAEIMTLMQDPRADSMRLARLVHGDPALAAHVLRVANSPAWRGRARIVTLQQAVARLGMGALQEIVLSAAIAGVYQVKGHEDVASNVWRHAIGTALFAKATARLRRRNVESAFIGGLLHSVGRPVALWELLRLIKKHRMNCTPIAVRSAVDLGHEKVGMALAASWKLPEVVQSVIAHVADPSQATEHQDAIRTVAFGAEVAHRALTQVSGDLIPESAEALVPFRHSRALDLYPNHVIAILEQTPKVFAAIRAMSA
jgi:HD-like signal output (HDOD) protein